MTGLKISASGDSAIFCFVGEGVSLEVNRRVYALENQLLTMRIKGIIETVPSYNGVMIYFDPLVIDQNELHRLIGSISGDNIINPATYDLRTIVIPVFYGKEYGPDLEIVADINNLDTDEVVSIHSGTDYHIYMLGFTPGFPYLGGMDSRIVTPRKKEPRLKIAAGSVGIAGEQTGIYPIESPGGWQIIGRTPVKLFNPGSGSPFLLEPGLSLRFNPVGFDEFVEISSIIENNQYKPEYIIG